MDLQNSPQQHKTHTHKLQIIQYFPFVILKVRELRYALSFIILVISTVAITRLVSPFDPHDFIFRFRFSSNNNSRANSSGVCNDFSYGRWVRDDLRPLQSYHESCLFLDPGFRCRQNGRKDEGYRRWRWQPDGCDLPRWDSLLEVFEFLGHLINLCMHGCLLCMSMLSPVFSLFIRFFFFFKRFFWERENIN